MFKFIILTALVGCVFANAVGDINTVVLEESSDVRPDGFVRRLKLDNGIIDVAEGMADGSIVGGYAYISPEGEEIDIKYVADENGYQPIGHVLPTPPPIPDYIMRAIEYINSHPSSEEHNKKH